MADAESKKIIGRVWASAPLAERENPADQGITRARGWPVSYEQVGAGKEPERTIFNQRFRELDGCFEERIRYGGIIPWDIDIDYFQWARVIGSDGHKYYAVVATGPSLGNASDPVTDNGVRWKLY